MSPTLVPYTSGQLLKLPPGTKNLQNNQPVTNGFWTYRFLDDKVTPIVGSTARIRTNIRMLFFAGRTASCHGTYLIVSQGFLEFSCLHE
jgi:hypothetical protein